MVRRPVRTSPETPRRGRNVPVHRPRLDAFRCPGFEPLPRCRFSWSEGEGVMMLGPQPSNQQEVHFPKTHPLIRRCGLSAAVAAQQRLSG